MNYKFTCDTNILFSFSYYYCLQNGGYIICEDSHGDVDLILRYFENKLNNEHIKFGIITDSILNEINEIKENTIHKKLSEIFRQNHALFEKISKEISMLMNAFDDNLEKAMRLFEKGKANINQKRVKKRLKEINKMYDEFEEKSRTIGYDERERGRKTIAPIIRRREIVKGWIREAYEKNKQIVQLNCKPVEDSDKEILAEIVYERYRFIQEHHSLSKDFKFYFISNDTHFSQKFSTRLQCYSRQITDKIKELFNIECVTAKEFKDLIEHF